MFLSGGPRARTSKKARDDFRRSGINSSGQDHSQAVQEGQAVGVQQVPSHSRRLQALGLAQEGAAPRELHCTIYGQLGSHIRPTCHSHG